MYVCVSATRWGHINAGIGLRNDVIVSLRCDGDTGLTAAYGLDETLRTWVRLVATMLAIVSAKFGVDRTRSGRDIR